MAASSGDQNSFARRKAKFNPTVLVKLSSLSEMMKKEEEEGRFAEEKAPLSRSKSQNGKEQQARYSRKDIKRKCISREKHKKKKPKRKKGERLWDEE